MGKLIRKIGLTPLLELPDSIWQQLNKMEELDTNIKFVLATLYYLDSRGKLSSLRERLPRYTFLEWDLIERALKLLAQLNIIEYRDGRVTLRIKPIKYR